MLRKFVTAAACAAIAIGVAAPAASADAPSLGGERLMESDPTTTSCNVTSSGGSFSFEASGTATGPYPGTFTELGTITVGPEDAMGRHRVTAVSIQFAIDSAVGQVTGTQQYVPTGDAAVNPALAKCEHTWEGLRSNATVFADDLRYSATILTPEGQTCAQGGPATLSLVDNSALLADSFDQWLYADSTAPIACEGGEPEPPAEPASKEDCWDGGWQRYWFRNQGECIAYVVHQRKA